MDRPITAKTLVLSMLQASRNQAMPVKTLILIGELFGFSGNRIRVCTARLLQEGTIQSDGRGLYQLSSKAARVSRYIDRWWQGENRLKHWSGDWLCCLLPKMAGRKLSIAVRGFDLLGFKEGLPGLWVRPDNLTLELEEVTSLHAKVGKTEPGEMFVGSGFQRRLIEQWAENLWPVATILEKQLQFLEKMEQSANQLDKMSPEKALLESFLIGSEAIQLLVMDPLLPVEMMDNRSRIKLTEMMLDYDGIGKRIWSKRFSEIRINRAPTHMQLIAAV